MPPRRRSRLSRWPSPPHPEHEADGEPLPERARSAQIAALEAAAASHLTRPSRRMLAAVLRVTVHEDRIACDVPIIELAAVSKQSPAKATRALRLLAAHGIIELALSPSGRAHVALPQPETNAAGHGTRDGKVRGTAYADMNATRTRNGRPAVDTAVSHPPGDRKGGRAKRMSWGVADQALSSVTNVALSILVAHAVGVRGFGVFGLAFATYTFSLGVTRSLCSEPFSVRFSASDEHVWRRAARSSTGTVVALTTPMALACVALGALNNSSTGDAFAALGVCLPGLALQDAWRMAFFAKGRGRQAFINDLAWSVVQIPAMLAAVHLGVHTVAPLILCWGGAASIAAVWGVAQSRVVPEPDRAFSWMRAQRDLAPRFFVEFLARYGANAGTIYVTALIAGVSAAGAFRAGQVLLGPINLFNIGLTGVAVYEAVQLRERPRRMQRMAMLLGLGIAGVSFAWGGLMLAIPSDVGTMLLSQSWGSAHNVLLPLTIAAGASGILTGATVGLRALAAADRSLRVRLITAVITLAASSAGAEAFSAVGAACGLAFGLWVGAALWTRELNLAVRDVIIPPTTPSPEPVNLEARL